MMVILVLVCYYTKLRNLKHGNPGCSEVTKKVTSDRLKGKTYEEIYGEEKGKQLRAKKKLQIQSPESIIKANISRAKARANFTEEKKKLIAQNRIFMRQQRISVIGICLFFNKI